MQSHRALLFASVLGTAALSPAQLAGYYVIGPGGNYPDMSAAIAALIANGVSAPVGFLVTANQTGPWTIPAFPGQGATNPVIFDAIGTITIGGAQPVLTLSACHSVIFRGFSGTFSGSTNAIVVNGGAAECVFQNIDFQANTVTAFSPAVFRFEAGNSCRIEDSKFGGSFEAVFSGTGDSNLTIRRCRIISGGWRIATLGGTNVTLVNNFITGVANYGINGGIPGTPTSAANLKIWNNTVYIVHPTSGSQYCSLRWYSSAAGTEVVNNIFFDQYPTLTTSVFNLWCSGTLRPALMNNNCLWSNQAGYIPVFASGNLTLAQWQGLGFDLNSIQANPQFAGAGTTPGHLSLQPTSPCAAGGATLPLVLEDYFQLPRVPAYAIGAHEEGLVPTAVYAVFGAGCAGSAGVPSNSASQLPQVGTTPVFTFGNLPAPYIALAVLGVSNTGPLPFDLGLIGAPGCFLRVSPDVTLAVAGAAGSASMSFVIPNQGTLVGFAFYTQALPLDLALNPLGFSASDAATVIVGP